jgi:hypothetical protein
MYRNIDHTQTAIGLKKAASHSLIFTRDTRNIDKEKSSVKDSELSVQYWNKSTHEQNLRSTPGQAEPIAPYFLKNSTTG